jgi:transcription elongation factor SPT6
MEKGQTPSVLAVSWGKGDPQVDAISLVFLDDGGRLREHCKLDNLSDDDNQKEFESLMERRTPDVIVVGGFSVQTTKLVGRLKEIVNNEMPESAPPGKGAPNVPGEPQTSAWGDKGVGSGWGESGGMGGTSSAWESNAGASTGTWGEPNRTDMDSGAVPPTSPASGKHGYIPVVYVPDDTARIYQHSKRASEEFSALSLTAKYCVGLARYTQSPMNEYAALGRDMAAITYDEDNQQLVGLCHSWAA